MLRPEYGNEYFKQIVVTTFNNSQSILHAKNTRKIYQLCRNKYELGQSKIQGKLRTSLTQSNSCETNISINKK